MSSGNSTFIVGKDSCTISILPGEGHCFFFTHDKMLINMRVCASCPVKDSCLQTM